VYLCCLRYPDAFAFTPDFISESNGCIHDDDDEMVRSPPAQQLSPSLSIERRSIIPASYLHHTSTSHFKSVLVLGNCYGSLVRNHTTATMTSPIPADARGFLLLTLPQAQVYQVNIAMIVLYGIPLTEPSPHIIRR
jgi:hypothetical protein